MRCSRSVRRDPAYMEAGHERRSSAAKERACRAARSSSAWLTMTRPFASTRPSAAMARATSSGVAEASSFAPVSVQKTRSVYGLDNREVEAARSHHEDGQGRVGGDNRLPSCVGLEGQTSRPIRLDEHESACAASTSMPHGGSATLPVVASNAPTAAMPSRARAVSSRSTPSRSDMFDGGSICVEVASTTRAPWAESARPPLVSSVDLPPLPTHRR